MTKKINIIFISFLLLCLFLSRLIPHPPNFTLFISASFYFSLILGFNYIFLILLTFILSDIFLGFHDISFVIWSLIIFNGYVSRFFKRKFLTRIFGVLNCSLIFFLVTNLSFWLFSGLYTMNFSGLIECYYFAIPFFKNQIISTLILSLFIELLIDYKFKKKLKTPTFNF